MRFVIVTGMSGAGKSTALKMLEDAGYFCVDNLPIALMGEVCTVCCGECSGWNTEGCVGVDIRSGESLDALEKILEKYGNESFEL